MVSDLIMRLSWRLILPIFGFSLISGVFVCLRVDASKKPSAPTVPVVSVCRQVGPGMRGIGDRDGIQFDVPETDFTIHEGASTLLPLRMVLI